MLEYINLHEVHHWIMMLGWFILVMVVFYLFDDKKEKGRSSLSVPKLDRLLDLYKTSWQDDWYY